MEKTPISEDFYKFVLLTKKLRDTQKKYFNFRSHQNLVEAKAIENKIDKVIKEKIEFLNNNTQEIINLFEDKQKRL